MRKSRRDSLDGAIAFHKMWRGHNREHVLGTDREKRRYLDALKRHKSKAAGLVLLFVYCVMGNHVHEGGGFDRRAAEDELLYRDALVALGNWMRSAHSVFGAWYNKVRGREGKVAYDRPKTVPVTSGRQLLTLMAYIDANPVRAGKVKHPSQYEFSSHNFYAHGKRNDFTDALDIPDVYLELGKTAALRQKKYRQIVDAYLRDAGLIDDSAQGDPVSILNSEVECTDCNDLGWDTG